MATLPVFVYEVPLIDNAGRELCLRSADSPRTEHFEAGDPPTTEAARLAAVAHYEGLGRTVHHSAAHPLVDDAPVRGPQALLYVVKES